LFRKRDKLDAGSLVPLAKRGSSGWRTMLTAWRCIAVPKKKNPALRRGLVRTRMSDTWFVLVQRFQLKAES